MWGFVLFLQNKLSADFRSQTNSSCSRSFYNLQVCFFLKPYCCLWVPYASVHYKLWKHLGGLSWKIRLPFFLSTQARTVSSTHFPSWEVTGAVYVVTRGGLGRDALGSAWCMLIVSKGYLLPLRKMGLETGEEDCNNIATTACFPDTHIVIWYNLYYLLQEVSLEKSCTPEYVPRQLYSLPRFVTVYLM